MANLRKSLIRLAYTRPEFRKALLPILKTADDCLERAAYGTPLDGLTRQRAADVVNKIMLRFTKGFFRDNSWKPVHEIERAMEKLNIPFYLEAKNGGYQKNDAGTPISKTWEIEVPFINNKNRPTCLYGKIICSGAGSVQDPLESYDVVAYVN